MKFYAHSTELKDKSNWHSLEEHLKQVGDKASDFALHLQYIINIKPIMLSYRFFKKIIIICTHIVE